jgi:hypothetical protein
VINRFDCACGRPLTTSSSATAAGEGDAAYNLLERDIIAAYLRAMEPVRGT